MWSDNVFLTLTYDNEHLPANGSLVPRDLTLFLKRLRKAYAPDKFRYFAVGEYGDKTQRPHYHLAVFNFPSCAYQITRPKPSCCKVCDLVRKSWGKGNVLLGSLEQASASYVCGYILKKMTAKDDTRLCGRHPEFTRMSLRPAIGRDAMDEVASVLMTHRLDQEEDVPASLRIGSHEWPLGRYLRQQLRMRIGRDAKAPQETIEAIRSELSVMWADSWDTEVGFYSESAFKKKVVDEKHQARLNQDARLKLKKRTHL